MRIFFDNCTAPRLASTLNGYVSQDGHRAWHIRDVTDLPSGHNSTDVEWINYLKKGKDWIFFSADSRILKNPAERAALKSASLHGFIFARGFMKMAVHEAASIMLWKWPEIENAFRSIDPAIYELQVGRQSRLKPINF